MNLLLKSSTGRDLADSWSIDVAAELDAYLTQLTAATQTGNDDSDELNFAEAALLLQNSTTVYTRKVDYLRAVTYETLSDLGQATGKKPSNAALAAVNKSRGGKRGYRDLEGLQSDVLTVPSDILKLASAKDINLPDSSLGPIDVDSFFDEAAPSAVEDQLIVRVPLVLQPRGDAEELLLEHGYIDQDTGVLLVDPADRFVLAAAVENAESRVKSENVAKAYESVGIYASDGPSATSAAGAAEQRTAAGGTLIQAATTLSTSEDHEPNSAGPGSATFSTLGSSTPAFATSAFAGTTSTKRSSNNAGFDSAEKQADHFGDDMKDKFIRPPPLTKRDLFAKLDCHSITGKDRPLRTGKTYRALDPDIYLRPAADLNPAAFCLVVHWLSSPTPAVGTLSELRLFEGERRAGTVKSVQGAATPYFTDILQQPTILKDCYGFGPGWESIEKVIARRIIRSETARQQNAKSGGRTEVDFSSFTKDFFSEEDQSLADHNATPYEVFEPDNMIDELQEEQMEQANELNGPAVDGPGALLPMKPKDSKLASPSVAEIELALMEAQKNYAEQTTALSSGGTLQCPGMSASLHRRMFAWRDTVSRWLEIMDKRGSFDVADYKDKVFTKHDAVSKTTGDNALGSLAADVVAFKTLIAGECRSEVCRYFLTALLLCNEGKAKLDACSMPTSSGPPCSVPSHTGPIVPLDAAKLFVVPPRSASLQIQLLRKSLIDTGEL